MDSDSSSSGTDPLGRSIEELYCYKYSSALAGLYF